MFLNFVICSSSLDDDVITLVMTIKRCQSLLIQVHIKLISIHPNLFCMVLMIVRGAIHLVRTHEEERGLSKCVGGRDVSTTKCIL